MLKAVGKKLGPEHKSSGVANKHISKYASCERLAAFSSIQPHLNLRLPVQPAADFVLGIRQSGR